MSYSDLDANVLRVFGTDAWKSEGIKTYPANMLAVNLGKEYVRVNILPASPGVNRTSISGILILEIYVAAGNGPKRASEIADKLNAYLGGKAFVTSRDVCVQIHMSTMRHIGVDEENTSLYRVDLTFPFNYFSGEP